MGKKITNEIINRVIELYKDDKKQNEISKEVGISKSAVCRIIKKFNSVSEEKHNHKLVKCNMPDCNRIFKTEVDNMGVPYKRRCPKCGNVLRNRGNGERGIYSIGR